MTRWEHLLQVRPGEERQPRSADVIAHDGDVRALALSPGVAFRMLGTLADRLSDRI